MKQEFSKVQTRIIEALRQKGTYIKVPYDVPGHRTGYITTGGIQGYICPVALSTFNILLQKGLIVDDNGVYRLVNSQTKGE